MYFIEFSSTARKDLASLPEHIQKRIESLADSMIQNPRPTGCKKLKGMGNYWRVRVGDYRMLYGIDDRSRFISIYRILHRKDAYR